MYVHREEIYFTELALQSCWLRSLIAAGQASRLEPQEIVDVEA